MVSGHLTCKIFDFHLHKDPQEKNTIRPYEEHCIFFFGGGGELLKQIVVEWDGSTASLEMDSLHPSLKLKLIEQELAVLMALLPFLH